MEQTEGPVLICSGCIAVSIVYGTFGLNLYEAKAYAGLLKTGTANAYKISRESGIPRARIYDVLESITNQGLAMVEESSENVKIYTPVPGRIFLDRIKKEWENDFEEAAADLLELETEEKKQDIYVFTVKGKENITAYCNRLLQEAENYVLVSIWEQIRKSMKNILKDVQEGKFAREWLLKNQTGRIFFNAKKQMESEHAMEKVGAELRGLMSWMKK